MSVIAVLYTVEPTRRDFRVKVLRRQNCVDIAAAREWFTSLDKTGASKAKEAVFQAEPALESNAAIEQLLHSQNHGRWFKAKSLLSPR